jgi:hypothetical protein
VHDAADGRAVADEQHGPRFARDESASGLSGNAGSTSGS